MSDAGRFQLGGQSATALAAGRLAVTPLRFGRRDWEGPFGKISNCQGATAGPKIDSAARGETQEK